MIDVSELIHDPDFCMNFSVVKKAAPVWVQGEQTATETNTIVEGIVLPSSSKDIDMLPEADHAHGLKTFFTDECSLDVTDTEKTSDTCIYKGKKYKLLYAFDYAENGYYKAIGTLLGDTE
ncbi:hypothetical protein [Pectinatus haikarae]|uniref:Uncharacterized protein n=1 Tax=Pectinatus haikarae TaxID=349096 RepID=A0ABT9Y430_9FIRM|nr:hypothetical protein [Pectinatus haikarae]MDQ0202481.1 hypothetical protein [Pectinatus haikarae]